jgi:hypothetical protein
VANGKRRKDKRGPIRDELIDLTTPQGVRRYLEEHPKVRGLQMDRDMILSLLRDHEALNDAFREYRRSIGQPIDS